MSQPREQFFICDCHSEGIFVSSWNEDGIHEVYVSFWQQGQEPHRFSIWRRFQMAAILIWRGTLYKDQVCFDKEKALAFAKFIQESVQ